MTSARELAKQAVINTFKEHGSVIVRDFDVDVGDFSDNWGAGDVKFDVLEDAISFVTERAGRSMRIMSPAGDISYDDW